MRATPIPGAADPPSAATGPTASAPAADEAPSPAWVTLSSSTTRASRSIDEPIRLRRVALQLCAAAVVVICVVGVAGTIISRRTAEKQSVHDAAEVTDVLAASVVQPALTDAMVGSETETARVLDPIVHHGILSTSLVRVKLWTLQGKVLYSDEPNLIGLTFPLDGEARASLLSKRTDASISDLQRPENRYERGQGRMLEVYRPMWTPNGQPLLLETYFRYQVVTERSHNLWRGFAGIMLSSLVAVFALMLPLVWALLHRTRRAQQQREAMMQRALAASQDERKRIAGTLHDGVVQQLAAASFTVSAEAARASVTGDQESASRLGSASAAVRSGMAGLRSLLVDIYPPSLTDGGLTVALNDMAGTMAGRDVDINVHVQDSTSDGLPAEIQEAIFRVAQESVRNAVRHAAAQRIDLTLTTVDGAVQLDVIDDGAGFDLPSKARASDRGHLGLRLIADVADRTGADLAIATSPTTGTHVRMNVAAQ